MLITRRSQISGKVHTLEIDCTPEQLAAWEGGVLIQNAMPDVNAPMREFIKSGITPRDWRQTFGPPPWAKKRRRA